MPSRIIREGWVESEAIASVSADAERFFLRLCLKADDFGRFHANPMILKSILFPLAQAVTQAEVSKWLEECRGAGLVQCYSSDGKRFVVIPKFGQRARAGRSKFPPPPEAETPPLEPKVTPEKDASFENTEVTPKMPVICQADARHMSGTCQADDGHMTGICPPNSESESYSESNANACAESGSVPPTHGGKFGVEGDAVIPSEAEVVTYGASQLGNQIPAPYCRHYHKNRSINRAWVKYGRVIDWREEVKSWWVGDREDYCARRHKAHPEFKSHAPHPTSKPTPSEIRNAGIMGANKAPNNVLAYIEKQRLQDEAKKQSPPNPVATKVVEHGSDSP